MQQASTEATATKADDSRGHVMPMNPLIDPFPGETIQNCSNVIQFLGGAVLSIAGGLSNLTPRDAAAIDHICTMVCDALDHEHKHGGRAAESDFNGANDE